MPKLATELGIKLVATNDVHYIKPQHAIAHNILLSIPEATSTFSPIIKSFATVLTKFISNQPMK